MFYNEYNNYNEYKSIPKFISICIYQYLIYDTNKKLIYIREKTKKSELTLIAKALIKNKFNKFVI